MESEERFLSEPSGAMGKTIAQTWRNSDSSSQCSLRCVSASAKDWSEAWETIVATTCSSSVPMMTK